MPKSLFLNKTDFLNTARYIYNGVLSQPFSIEKAEQEAIYLLKNGTILLPIDKKKDKSSKSDIAKTLYHPQKGLAYFMIKVALVPLIVELYTVAFVKDPKSKVLKSINKKEQAIVQRMLLFHELKNPALEYIKYCQNKKLYTSEQSLYEDSWVLAQMSTELELYRVKKIFQKENLHFPENVSQAKSLLMKEAFHAAQFALLLDQQIDSLFQLNSSYPQSLKVFIGFLAILSEMTKSLGLHQKDFIETSPQRLKKIISSFASTTNLKEQLIKEAGSYSKRLFDFCSSSEGIGDVDVLLAYQTLNQIELPNFKDLLIPSLPEKEMAIDPPIYISFNPAVEMNWDKLKKHSKREAK